MEREGGGKGSVLEGAKLELSLCECGGDIQRVSWSAVLEEDEVGTGADFEFDVFEAEQLSGIFPGHVDGILYGEFCGFDRVSDAGIGLQAASGEQLVLSGEHDPSIFEQIDFEWSFGVGAWRAAGESGCVAGDDGVLGCLGSDDGPDDAIGQVMTVGDDAGPQSRFAELFPDVVGVSSELPMGPVSEVSTESCSGIDGVDDLLGFRGGVSDGDDDTVAGDLSDEIGGPVSFGGERDESDALAGGVLQSAELVVVGCSNVFQRVGSSGSVFGRDVGTFEMATGDHGLDPIVFPAGLIDGLEACGERIEGVGDQGGAESCDARGEVRFEDFDDLFSCQRVAGEPCSSVSIDLEVEEGGCDEWPGLVIGVGRCWADLLDVSVGDFDRDGFERVVAACLESEVH